MRPARRSRQAGFTLTELMVVVGIMAVVAAIAIVSLRKSRVDTGLFADQVMGALNQARVQAVSTRSYYRVRFDATTVTTTSTTDKTLLGDCTTPMPPDGGASGTWSAISVLNAPSRAVVKAVTTAPAQPTAQQNFTSIPACIIFRPTYDIKVFAPSSGVNAYIYLDSPDGPAWRYVITVIGTGVTTSRPWG